MTSLFRRMIPALFVLAPGLALATPTSLPYEVDFLPATSTCDGAFVGTCPAGWQGIGADDSVVYVNQNDDLGVRITPGTAQAPNGIGRIFAVDPAYDGLSVSFLARATVGTATVRVKATFKNSSGATVDTQTFTTTADVDGTSVQADFAFPATAAVVQLAVLAANGSSSSTEVEVAAQQNAVSLPFTLLLVIESAAGEDTCDASPCDAPCNCDTDEISVRDCSPGTPPECIPVNICLCVSPYEILGM